MYKILNLFSGIGGNRTLWGDKPEITAVEYDPKIASIYQKNFPNDIVIIGDAYEYYEKHFHEFDIIWASPECRTHCQGTLINVGGLYSGYRESLPNYKLPDMRLYGLIISLKHHFRGNWIVENVRPIYEPLIRPTCIRGRHWYWSNISIPGKNKKSMKKEIGSYYSRLSIKESPDYRHEHRNKVDSTEGKILLDYLLGKQQISLEGFK